MEEEDNKAEGKEGQADREGAGICPKCGSPRTARPDCVKCGLVFDRWDPTALEPSADPVLDPVWRVLTGAFDDPARHDSFVEMARAHGKLDGAAARYRRHVQERGPSPVAEAKLEEIRALMLSDVMAPARPKRKRKPPSSRTWIWMLLVLALAALAIYIITSYSGPGGGKAKRSTSNGPGAEPVNLKK